MSKALAPLALSLLFAVSPVQAGERVITQGTARNLRTYTESQWNERVANHDVAIFTWDGRQVSGSEFFNYTYRSQNGYIPRRMATTQWGNANSNRSSNSSAAVTPEPPAPINPFQPVVPDLAVPVLPLPPLEPAFDFTPAELERIERDREHIRAVNQQNRIDNPTARPINPAITATPLIHKAGQDPNRLLELFDQWEALQLTLIRSAAYDGERLVPRVAQGGEDHLSARAALTQLEAQLSALRNPSAIVLTQTPISNQQRDAWIQEFWELGGFLARDLRHIENINKTRLHHGLNELQICIQLMLASTFYAQLMTDMGVSLAHHHGNYGRGGSAGVAEFFGINHRAGANGGMSGYPGLHGWVPTEPSILYGGNSHWYASPGHRANLLREGITYIGLGTRGNFVYMMTR